MADSSRDLLQLTPHLVETTDNMFSVAFQEEHPGRVSPKLILSVQTLFQLLIYLTAPSIYQIKTSLKSSHESKWGKPSLA